MNFTLTHIKLWTIDSFNKRIEDFNGNLRLYNDYLEESETMLHNLINDIDIQKTSETIERYRLENKDTFQKNLAKQIKDEKIIAFGLEKEKRERNQRRELYEDALKDQEEAKRTQQESIIDMLVNLFNLINFEPFLIS